MTLTVTIDRTALTLGPLTITDDGVSAYFVEPDTIADPGLDMRRTYAPDSAYVAGKQLLAAVLDAGFLPLSIIVQGTSSADLASKKAALEVAVSQFSFLVTITENGQARSWHADATWPAWGNYSAAMAGQFLARATLQIPVNP